MNGLHGIPMLIPQTADIMINPVEISLRMSPASRASPAPGAAESIVSARSRLSPGEADGAIRDSEDDAASLAGESETPSPFWPTTRDGCPLDQTKFQAHHMMVGAVTEGGGTTPLGLGNPTRLQIHRPTDGSLTDPVLEAAMGAAEAAADRVGDVPKAPDPEPGPGPFPDPEPVASPVAAACGNVSGDASACLSISHFKKNSSQEEHLPASSAVMNNIAGGTASTPSMPKQQSTKNSCADTLFEFARSQPGAINNLSKKTMSVPEVAWSGNVVRDESTFVICQQSNASSSKEHAPAPAGVMGSYAKSFACKQNFSSLNSEGESLSGNTPAPAAVATSDVRNNTSVCTNSVSSCEANWKSAPVEVGDELLSIATFALPTSSQTSTSSSTRKLSEEASLVHADTGLINSSPPKRRLPRELGQTPEILTSNRGRSAASVNTMRSQRLTDGLSQPPEVPKDRSLASIGSSGVIARLDPPEEHEMTKRCNISEDETMLLFSGQCRQSGLAVVQDDSSQISARNPTAATQDDDNDDILSADYNSVHSGECARADVRPLQFHTMHDIVQADVDAHTQISSTYFSVESDHTANRAVKSDGMSHDQMMKGLSKKSGEALLSYDDGTASQVNILSKDYVLGTTPSKDMGISSKNRQDPPHYQTAPRCVDPPEEFESIVSNGVMTKQAPSFRQYCHPPDPLPATSLRASQADKNDSYIVPLSQSACSSSGADSCGHGSTREDIYSRLEALTARRHTLQSILFSSASPTEPNNASVPSQSSCVVSSLAYPTCRYDTPLSLPLERISMRMRSSVSLSEKDKSKVSLDIGGRAECPAGNIVASHGREAADLPMSSARSEAPSNKKVTFEADSIPSSNACYAGIHRSTVSHRGGTNSTNSIEICAHRDRSKHDIDESSSDGKGLHGKKSHFFHSNSCQGIERNPEYQFGVAINPISAPSLASRSPCTNDSFYSNNLLVGKKEFLSSQLNGAAPTLTSAVFPTSSLAAIGNIYGVCTSTGNDPEVANYPVKALAKKILSEKILNGYTMARNHCERCNMALMCKSVSSCVLAGDEECVFCPAIELRRSIARGVRKCVMVSRLLSGPGIDATDGQFYCESCQPGLGSSLADKGRDAMKCQVCPILDISCIEIIREQGRGAEIQHTRRCANCGSPKLRYGMGDLKCIVCGVLNRCLSSSTTSVPPGGVHRPLQSTFAPAARSTVSASVSEQICLADVSSEYPHLTKRLSGMHNNQSHPRQQSPTAPFGGAASTLSTSASASHSFRSVKAHFHSRGLTDQIPLMSPAALKGGGLLSKKSFPLQPVILSQPAGSVQSSFQRCDTSKSAFVRPIHQQVDNQSPSFIGVRDFAESAHCGPSHATKQDLAEANSLQLPLEMPELSQQTSPYIKLTSSVQLPEGTMDIAMSWPSAESRISQPDHVPDLQLAKAKMLQLSLEMPKLGSQTIINRKFPKSVSAKPPNSGQWPESTLGTIKSQPVTSSSNGRTPPPIDLTKTDTLDKPQLAANNSQGTSLAQLQEKINEETAKAREMQSALEYSSKHDCNANGGNFISPKESEPSLVEARPQKSIDVLEKSTHTSNDNDHLGDAKVAQLASSFSVSQSCGGIKEGSRLPQDHEAGFDMAKNAQLEQFSLHNSTTSNLGPRLLNECQVKLEQTQAMEPSLDHSSNRSDTAPSIEPITKMDETQIALETSIQTMHANTAEGSSKAVLSSSRSHKEFESELGKAKEAQLALEKVTNGSNDATQVNVENANSPSVIGESVEKLFSEVIQQASHWSKNDKSMSYSISQQEIDPTGQIKEYIPQPSYFHRSTIPDVVQVYHIPEDLSVAQSYHTMNLKRSERPHANQGIDCCGVSSTLENNHLQQQREQEHYDYDTIGTDEHSLDQTLNTMDELMKGDWYCVDKEGRRESRDDEARRRTAKSFGAELLFSFCLNYHGCGGEGEDEEAYSTIECSRGGLHYQLRKGDAHLPSYKHLEESPEARSGFYSPDTSFDGSDLSSMHQARGVAGKLPNSKDNRRLYSNNSINYSNIPPQVSPKHRRRATMGPTKRFNVDEYDYHSAPNVASRKKCGSPLAIDWGSVNLASQGSDSGSACIATEFRPAALSLKPSLRRPQPPHPISVYKPLSYHFSADHSSIQSDLTDPSSINVTRRRVTFSNFDTDMGLRTLAEEGGSSDMGNRNSLDIDAPTPQTERQVRAESIQTPQEANSFSFDGTRQY